MWSQDGLKVTSRPSGARGDFKVNLYVSWISKASRASVYRSWRGGTYTYPKWPRMQNICKTHMKHTHLHMWCVCEAYVQRKWKHMWAVCETYVKHMRKTCDTLMYFGTGLRCVYALLMYTFANSCVFNVGGKKRPYFVQITPNMALFWTARKENKQNANENANTFCNVCVCTCVWFMFFLCREKNKPLFWANKTLFYPLRKRNASRNIKKTTGSRNFWICREYAFYLRISSFSSCVSFFPALGCSHIFKASIASVILSAFKLYLQWWPSSPGWNHWASTCRSNWATRSGAAKLKAPWVECSQHLFSVRCSSILRMRWSGSMLCTSRIKSCTTRKTRGFRLASGTGVFRRALLDFFTPVLSYGISWEISRCS